MTTDSPWRPAMLPGVKPRFGAHGSACLDLDLDTIDRRHHSRPRLQGTHHAIDLDRTAGCPVHLSVLAGQPRRIGHCHLRLRRRGCLSMFERPEHAAKLCSAEIREHAVSAGVVASSSIGTLTVA